MSGTEPPRSTAARGLALGGLALLTIGQPVSRLFPWGLAPLVVGAGVLAVVAAALAVARRPDRPRVGAPVEAAAVLGFLAAALVASFRPGALLDRSVALELLLRYAAWAGLYFGLLQVLRADGTRALSRGVAVLVVLGAAVQLGLSAAREAGGAGDRLGNSFGNPNFLAAVVNAAAFLLLPLLLARPRRKALALLPLLLAAATIVLTGSRGALLTAVATLGVAGVLEGVLRARRMVLLGSLFAAVAVAVLLVQNPLSRRLKEQNRDRSYPRPFLYEVAVHNAVEHPLGVGPGMNRYAFLQRALKEDEPLLVHRRHQIGLVHNVVLGSAVELGWLGAAAVLLFCGAFVLRQARAGRATPQLGRGAFYGGLVILLHAQLDGLVQADVVMVHFMTLLALHRSYFGWVREVAAAGPLRRGWRLAMGAAAVAVLTGGPALIVGSNAYLRHGERLATAGRPAEALAALETSRALLPWNPRPTRRILDLLDADAARCTTPALAARIVAEEERLVAANPLDPAPFRDMVARRTRAFETGNRADRRFLDAIAEAAAAVLERDPYDLAMRYRLGMLELLRGRVEATRAQWDEVLAVEPDFVPIHEALGDLARKEGDVEQARAHYFDALLARDGLVEKVQAGRYGTLEAYRSLLDTIDPARLHRRLAELPPPAPEETPP